MSFKELEGTIKSLQPVIDKNREAAEAVAKKENKTISTLGSLKSDFTKMFKRNQAGIERIASAKEAFTGSSVLNLDEIKQGFEFGGEEAKTDLEKGIEGNILKFQKASGLFLTTFNGFGKGFSKEAAEALKRIKDSTGGSAEGFNTIFGKASEAVKELTGGVIDLQDMYDDAVKSVQAATTLVTTPFKLANTAIAKTSKFFTGKEFNIGEKMNTFLRGTGKVIDEETGKVDDGVLGKFTDAMDNVRANFIGGAKQLMKSVTRLAKTGFLALKNGFAAVGKQMMVMGAQMLAAIGPMIAAGTAFVAGLVATTVGMLVAAAPMIGIALAIGAAVAALVLGIMYVKDNFESIKATIMEKVNTFVTGVRDAVSAMTEGFMNTWYSITDWVMGKILKWKGRLFGLSEEDEAELAAIEQRKADREAARNREEAVVAEQEAIQDEFVAQQQERQNLTEAETQQLREDTAVQARVEAEQRIVDQERSVGELERERNTLVRTQESGVSAAELNAFKEERVQLELAKFDEQTANGGMMQVSSRRLRAQRGVGALVTAEDRDAYEAALREVGNATAEDAQARIDVENERLDRIEALNTEIALKQSAVIDGDLEGQELERQVVESRVLSDREIANLEKEKHREQLGLSQEEYNRRLDEELERELMGDDLNYTSQFLDDLQATELTADELRNAASARDEAVAESQQQQSNVNMANNAVQQVNVSNNRRVIADPAPHNPEPTGSRLSVVPA